MDRTTGTIAAYPGTFDPITNGHVDLIRRGAGVFGELVVAVGDNPEKTCLLSAAERLDLAKAAVGELGLPNVRVERYGGLTVDFARQIGATVLLRGIRDPSDLHYEMRIAHTNRQMTGVETAFMLPAPQWAFLSSELVRQIARQGRDVSAMVPAAVAAHLARRENR